MPKMLYKWNHVVCDLLRLAFFIQHNASEIHPVQFSSVQFSRSVVSNSLRPCDSQHASPPLSITDSWRLGPIYAYDLHFFLYLEFIFSQYSRNMSALDHTFFSCHLWSNKIFKEVNASLDLEGPKPEMTAPNMGQLHITSSPPNWLWLGGDQGLS